MAVAATAPAAVGAVKDARRIVLFDFDSVLVRGDSYAAFVRSRYARAWLRAIALLPLAPLALVLVLAAGGRRILVRVFVRVALFGLGEARYRRLAHDSRKLSRDAFGALMRHRHAGDHVLVVTGCEETLARVVLDELGLRDVDLVASRFAFTRSGPRVAVRNVGREKLKQLARLGVEAPWDVAYSDSLVDTPMLDAAREPVLVNPTSRAFARAKARLGERVRRVDWH